MDIHAVALALAAALIAAVAIVVALAVAWSRAVLDSNDSAARADKLAEDNGTLAADLTEIKARHQSASAHIADLIREITPLRQMKADIAARARRATEASAAKRRGTGKKAKPLLTRSGERECDVEIASIPGAKVRGSGEGVAFTASGYAEVVDEYRDPHSAPTAKPRAKRTKRPSGLVVNEKTRDLTVKGKARRGKSNGSTVPA